MISPFSEGSSEEIQQQSAAAAEEALLAAGYTAEGDGDFTNGQYDVGFAAFNQTLTYSVLELSG